MGLTPESNRATLIEGENSHAPLRQPDNFVLCASLISWPRTARLVEYSLAVDFTYGPK